MSEPTRLPAAARASGRCWKNRRKRWWRDIYLKTDPLEDRRDRDRETPHARHSQAVRLPKEFRFEGREVRVTKVGRRVILEPMEPDESMPWPEIDQFGDLPFMPEEREQPDAPKATRRNK